MAALIISTLWLSYANDLTVLRQRLSKFKSSELFRMQLQRKLAMTAFMGAIMSKGIHSPIALKAFVEMLLIRLWSVVSLS